MPGEAPIVRAALRSLGGHDEQVALVIRLGSQYSKRCLEVRREIFPLPREADRASEGKGSFTGAASEGKT